MTHIPKPMVHVPRAKREAAQLAEVAHWVERAMEHERRTGVGEFLTPVKLDFRGVKKVADTTVAIDIPNDPHRVGLILTLHSGQEYRISIEEK